MVTRRTLLKRGVCTTLGAATASMLARTAFSQNAPSTGFDFYISPTGSDSSPGTFDQPWAITAINTRGRDYAGKRVGLLDGTYNVHALCQAAPDNAPGLSVNGGPDAATPTVVAAVNARKAILTGANPPTGAYPSNGNGIIGQGYLQVANPGNVILDGLTVTRGWVNGIFFFPRVPRPNTSEGGTTGIVVRNCELYDVDGIEQNNPGGIKLRNCTAALISNNKIHSVKPEPAGRNSAAIFAFASHSNVYEFNTIYDCYTGIHDKNPHNGNQTVRYNYIELTGPKAIIALLDCSGGDPGEVITVHNNILCAPGTWNGSDAVVPSKQSVVFYNNTCYNTSSDPCIYYPAGGAEVSPPATVKFYNNILYLSAAVGWAGLVNFLAGTVALSNYNLYRREPGPRGIFGVAPVSKPRGGPWALYTLKEWQKATGHDGSSVESSVSSSALFAATNRMDPLGYSLKAAALGHDLGRMGGVASGAPTDAGAWGAGAKRIGCNF